METYNTSICVGGDLEASFGGDLMGSMFKEEFHIASIVLIIFQFCVGVIVRKNGDSPSGHFIALSLRYFLDDL